jgi:hypothetical protein
MVVYDIEEFRKLYNDLVSRFKNVPLLDKEGKKSILHDIFRLLVNNRENLWVNESSYQEVMKHLNSDNMVEYGFHATYHKELVRPNVLPLVLLCRLTLNDKNFIRKAFKPYVGDWNIECEKEGIVEEKPVSVWRRELCNFLGWHRDVVVDLFGWY